FHLVSIPQQSEEVRGLDHLLHFGELLRQARPLPIIIQQPQGGRRTFHSTSTTSSSSSSSSS
ncbi:arsenite-activated atpase family protein, partial [Cystoisospora suis]